MCGWEAAQDWRLPGPEKMLKHAFVVRGVQMLPPRDLALSGLFPGGALL